MDLTKTPFCLTEVECQQVETLLSGMTDQEKIGQLFCVMGGDYPPEVLQRMAAEGRIGGVLFRPVQTADQVRAQLEALDQAAKIPLLKAANLEQGGSGGSLDGTLFGWPMLTAATDDPAVAETFGRVCGGEGAAAGVNWSFSPVCDLDINPQNPITNVRTYGSDPERVKKMTRAYVRGMQAQGVTACAKHFPGDGVDYRDQHLHPSVNSLSAADWYASYGEIYRALIGDGLLSIMVGHIAQPNVAREAEPTLTEEEALMPATLSPVMLGRVLRERLGFEGLITTDATIMAGYTQAMPRRQALARSIMAGCDMLVFNTDFEEDFSYLEQALRQGELTRQRLDDAVRRILALKARVCRPAPDYKLDARALYRQAARRAVTMVKNLQLEALPLTREKYEQILLIPLGQDKIPEGSITGIARALLEQRGFRVTVYDREADNLHGTSRLPAKRLTLYLANLEQYSNQTAIRIFWSPRHALDVPRFCWEEPSVFVSFANPYHLQDVPRVKTYINAYTATRDTIEAVIDKLAGEEEFTGVSPVDAFCGLPDTHY